MNGSPLFIYHKGKAFPGYSSGVGTTPFGGVGTVEGMTSSLALTERLLWMQRREEEVEWEKRRDASDAAAHSILSDLPDKHPLWCHASNAIANLCVTIHLLTSCQQIMLGGGVMNRSMLYDRMQREMLVLLNGYLDVEDLSSEEKLKSVICASGLVGAFALALDSLEEEKVG